MSCDIHPRSAYALTHHVAREDLQGCRETLGDKHPETLISIGNLSQILEAQGNLEGAAALAREAAQGEA